MQHIEGLTAPGPEGSRGSHGIRTCRTTLVFSDIAGFTQLTQRMGDLACYRLVQTCQRLVAQVARCEDGELLEIRGDGFLAAFADSVAAATFAIGIQRELEQRAELRTRMRIGMHTGEVVRDGARFYGRNVIFAFRISGFAEPDEILLSQATRRELPPDRFVLGCSREVRLKGFERPERVWRMAWRRPAQCGRVFSRPAAGVRTARVGSSGFAEVGAIGV